MTRTFFYNSLVTRKTQQAGGIGLEADDGDFDPEDKQLVDTTTAPLRLGAQSQLVHTSLI